MRASIYETKETISRVLKNNSKIKYLAEKTKGKTEVILVGTGSSYHACLACVNKLKQEGVHKIDALYPYQVDFKYIPETSLVICVSQSGKSKTVIDIAQEAKSLGIQILTVTGSDRNSLSEIGQDNINVQCNEEIPVAKTKGFSATVMTLMLFLFHHYHLELHQLEMEMEQIYQEFDEIMSQVEQWVEGKKERMKDCRDIRVVCTSEQLGIGLEAALKMVETLRVPVSCVELNEYIHGVYNACNENSCLFFIQSGKEVDKINKLKEIISEWTTQIYTLKIGEWTDIELTKLEGLVLILPFQLLSALIPLENGIDPSIAKDPMFHTKMNSK